jgi:cytochrome c
LRAACPDIIQERARMKSLLGLLMAFWLLSGAQAYAGDGGSPDEAKLMAVQAAQLLRDSGPEKAFPTFNDKQSPAFHDRDLYVMVYDATGRNVAHGASPALIGKDLIDLKDTEGKPVIRALVAIADEGWVDYKWPDPISKKIRPKRTYVVRVGEYFVGVGAYQ